MSTASLPSSPFMWTVRPSVVSTIAPGSVVGAGLETAAGSRPFSSRATYTAKAMPNTAISRRILRCQRLMLLQIGERQLDVGVAVVMILFERERDVQRGLVLLEELVALRRAPGD